MNNFTKCKIPRLNSRRKREIERFVSINEGNMKVSGNVYENTL